MGGGIILCSEWLGTRVVRKKPQAFLIVLRRGESDGGAAFCGAVGSPKGGHVGAGRMPKLQGDLFLHLVAVANVAFYFHRSRDHGDHHWLGVPRD